MLHLLCLKPHWIQGVLHMASSPFRFRVVSHSANHIWIGNTRYQHVRVFQIFSSDDPDLKCLESNLFSFSILYHSFLHFIFELKHRFILFQLRHVCITCLSELIFQFSNPCLQGGQLLLHLSLLCSKIVVLSVVLRVACQHIPHLLTWLVLQGMVPLLVSETALLYQISLKTLQGRRFLPDLSARLSVLILRHVFWLQNCG
mmetsp:Transcript_23306/g.43255  ORF Transcript_23306/g.43255 Transcript_23306/m.43255 type:complete len:201 (-) Transcript_23306:2524-3126(-)